MLARYLQIHSYYHAMDAIQKAKFAFKDVNFRHLVMPSEKISSSRKPYANDNKWMQATFDLGKKDGAAADGTSFDHAVEMHQLMMKADPRIVGHTLETFIEAKTRGEFAEPEPSVQRETTSEDEPEKCRAIALGAGGSWGAYEVGVLKGLTSDPSFVDDFKYDVVTGVSAGSINALAVGTFPIG